MELSGLAFLQAQLARFCSDVQVKCPAQCRSSRVLAGKVWKGRGSNAIGCWFQTARALVSAFPFQTVVVLVKFHCFLKFTGQAEQTMSDRPKRGFNLGERRGQGEDDWGKYDFNTIHPNNSYFHEYRKYTTTT